MAIIFFYLMVLFASLLNFIHAFEGNIGFAELVHYPVKNMFACDYRFINQSFGILTSPNFPMSYPNDTNCIWNIEMAKNERIVITVKTFILAPGDELVILNGDKTTTYSLGYPPNDVIYSHDNHVKIQLKSNMLTDMRSVNLMQGNYSFYAEFEKEGCGGFFTEDSGYFQVPSYIYLSRASHECAWTILSPINKVIVLQFLQFDLPPGSCLYSNVYIREGDQTGGYVLGDFCEENPPLNSLRTASNIMYIAYRTRPNLLSTRLDMTPMLRMYYKIVDTCGGTLNGFSGSFATPRRWLDGKYECNWTISIPEQKHIHMKFDKWKVVNASDSEYDELNIVIPERNLIFWKSKGIPPPDSLIIPSNNVVVFLKSYRKDTSTVKLSLHGIYQAINMRDKRCIDVGHKSLFMCDEWRYIDCSLRCDGIIDCENGVDERYCPITSLDSIVMQHLHHREDRNKIAFTYIFYILMAVAVLIIFLFFTVTRAYFIRKDSRKNNTSQLFSAQPPPYTELPTQSSSIIAPPPPPYSEETATRREQSFPSRKRRARGIPTLSRYRVQTVANLGSPEYEYASATGEDDKGAIATANIRYFSEEDIHKMRIRRKSLSPKSRRKKSLNEKFVLNLPNLTEENTVSESSRTSLADALKNPLRSSVSDNSFAIGKIQSKDSSAELRSADIRSMPDLSRACRVTTPDAYPVVTPSVEFQAKLKSNESIKSDDSTTNSSSSENESGTESGNEESSYETEMFHNTDILEKSSEYYSTTSSLESIHSNARVEQDSSSEPKSSPDDENITKITTPNTSIWSDETSPENEKVDPDEPTLSDTPTLTITSTAENSLSPDSIEKRSDEEKPITYFTEDSLEPTTDL